MKPLPDNAILVTLNVSSLNTNIPHNEVIEACHHFLNTRQDKTLPTERICDLIRMILAMNNFPLTISISCKFMELQWEIVWHPLTQIDNAPFKPLIWRRFIDDIFMV